MSPRVASVIDTLWQSNMVCQKLCPIEICHVYFLMGFTWIYQLAIFHETEGYTTDAAVIKTVHISPKMKRKT
jgi:hypothetical protein